MNTLGKRLLLNGVRVVEDKFWVKWQQEKEYFGNCGPDSYSIEYLDKCGPNDVGQPCFSAKQLSLILIRWNLFIAIQ